MAGHDSPCRSLASIMASAGHREARFLSLDVEGAEALVLSTVDPAIFDVIMVETQAHDADARRRIEEARTRYASDGSALAR